MKYKLSKEMIGLIANEYAKELKEKNEIRAYLESTKKWHLNPKEHAILFYVENELSFFEKIKIFFKRK